MRCCLGLPHGARRRLLPGWQGAHRLMRCWKIWRDS